MIKIESNNPMLSVVVPISNMYGRMDQLFYWVRQSEKYSVQIIFVHDVVDSETGKELRRFAAQNNNTNLTLIEGKYGSPGFTRNAGLAYASGDWIAFWDSDDLPNVPNVVKALLEVDPKVEVIIGNFSTKNTKNGSIRSDYCHNHSIWSIAMNPGIWRMSFKSTILNNLNFTDLKLGEDQVFLSQINISEKNFKFVDDNFYQYSTGQSSQLTKSRLALKDLPFASRLILDKITKKSGRSLYFDLIMIIRQQLTILKSGEFTLYLKVILLIIVFLNKINYQMIKTTINAMCFVIKNVKNFQIK